MNQELTVQQYESIGFSRAGIYGKFIMIRKIKDNQRYNYGIDENGIVYDGEECYELESCQ